MAFCVYCGTQLPEGATECPACHAPIAHMAPAAAAAAAVEPVAEAAQQAAEPVVEAVQQAAEPVVETVQQVAEPVVEAVQQAAEPVVEAVQQAAEPVVEAVQPVAPAPEAPAPAAPEAPAAAAASSEIQMIPGMFATEIRKPVDPFYEMSDADGADGPAITGEYHFGQASAGPQAAAPQYAQPQAAAPQPAAPQYTQPQAAAPQPAAPQYTQPQQAAPQPAAPQYTQPQQAAPQQAAPQYTQPQPQAPYGQPQQATYGQQAPYGQPQQPGARPMGAAYSAAGQAAPAYAGQPPMQAPKKKSALPIVLGLVAAALVVIGLIAFLLLRGGGAASQKMPKAEGNGLSTLVSQAVANNQGTSTPTTPSTTEPQPTTPDVGSTVTSDSLAGYWEGITMESEGELMDLAEWKEYLGDTYLDLREDGTGRMVVFDEEQEITYDEGNIYADGESAPFTVSGDELTLDVMGEKIVYARGTGSAPAPSGNTGSTTVAPTTNAAIETGTNWYGWIRVTEGTGTVEDRFIPCTAVIGNDGKDFFECYTEERELAFMSLYIDIVSPQFFTADIGEEDAWALNYYLMEDDEWMYSGVLSENGALVLDYDYDEGSDGSGHVTIYLHLQGEPFDENSELLPPDYYED